MAQKSAILATITLPVDAKGVPDSCILRYTPYPER